MRLNKVLLAAAAVSLTASPVLASANPASKLSVAPAARASAKAGKSHMAGGFFIPLIAIAAVIAGIVVVADTNNSPTSP